MSKYDFDDKNGVQLGKLLLAHINELAESNRLKRLELLMLREEHAIDFGKETRMLVFIDKKELEDQA